MGKSAFVRKRHLTKLRQRSISFTKIYSSSSEHQGKFSKNLTFMARIIIMLRIEIIGSISPK